MTGEEFARRIVAWQGVSGRRHLPWQRPATPYRIWVSKIMLQQTQVATVIPYFERFMARFRSPRELAGAPLDEVLHHWSGLGYYARARHLHAAARRICDTHGARMPATYDELIGLPGIGRSTAGAILALAYQRRYPILDGNVRRVLARHRLIEGWPGEAAVQGRLWRTAEALVPTRDIPAYTQGLMDLGATVCTRRGPDCTRCPVSADCRAVAQGRQETLPAPRPRRPRPLRAVTLAVVCNRRGEVLLERRPPTGIWGGLWSLPQLTDPAAALQWCTRTLGTPPSRVAPWPEVEHGFTHFRLRITPIHLVVESPALRVMEGARFLWYNRARSRGGLAAPIARLIGQLPDPSEE